MKKKNMLALFLCLGALGFVTTSLADNKSENLPIVYYEDYDLDEALGLIDSDKENLPGPEKKDEIEEDLEKDLEKAIASIEDEMSREESKEVQSGSTRPSNSSQGSKDSFPYPAGDRPIENQKTRPYTSRKKNYTADSTEGPIKGNRLTGVYHTPGQRDYKKISVKNVTWFYSEEEAISKGYSHAQR